MVRFTYYLYRFACRVETAFAGGLCLCPGEGGLLTNVYIDSFNLYYRALKDTPSRLLGVRMLAYTPVTAGVMPVT